MQDFAEIYFGRLKPLLAQTCKDDICDSGNAQMVMDWSASALALPDVPDAEVEPMAYAA